MATNNWTKLENITEEKDCKVEPGMDGGGRIWFPECPESKDEAMEKYLKSLETCKIDNDCKNFPPGFAGNRCIERVCKIPKCSDSSTVDSDVCECSGSTNGEFCMKSECLSNKKADGGKNNCPPSDLKPFTSVPMPEYLSDTDWPSCASSEEGPAGKVVCLPERPDGKTCTKEKHSNLVGRMEKYGLDYCSSHVEGGAESIKVAFTVLLVALLI